MPARASKGFRNFACRSRGRRAWANVYCSQVSLPAVPRSDVGSSHVYLWTSLWAWWQPLLSKCLLRELKGEAHLPSPLQGHRLLLFSLTFLPTLELLWEKPRVGNDWVSSLRKAKPEFWLGCVPGLHTFLYLFLCQNSKISSLFAFLLEGLFYQIYLSHAGGQGSWWHMRPA